MNTTVMEPKATMPDAELIRSEIAKVMARAHPPVIMTIQDVADMLGYSYSYTQQNIVCKPDFPHQLDRFKNPRWSRDEVMTWARVH